MKLQYTITRWDGRMAPKARAFHKVYRSDIATGRLWYVLYEMLAGDGALDTERGRRLLREYRDARNAGQLGPPPHGSIRSREFRLYGEGKDGPYVEFRAERV